MKSGIEGALLDAEYVAGNLLHTLGDGPAVPRSKSDRSQNQQVEGALREIDALGHFRPLSLLQDAIPSLVEAQDKSRNCWGRVPTPNRGGPEGTKFRVTGFFQLSPRLPDADSSRRIWAM